MASFHSGPFREHISNACKKASRRGSVSKIPLYKMSILRSSAYCGMVFHFCIQPDKHKLERVQERALRTVFQDQTSSYEELLMYKVTNDLGPKSLQVQCMLERQILNNQIRQSSYGQRKVNALKQSKFGNIEKSSCGSREGTFQCWLFLAVKIANYGADF